MTEPVQIAAWRRRLHEIIFEADTAGGKAFDIALLVAILASVLAVMLDSVKPIREKHGGLLSACEWLFTVLFTIEYVLRLVCVGRPIRYATSFFGVIDLLAVIPTYVSLVWPGSQSLMVIRSLRLLRTFRILKLGWLLSEAAVLRRAIWESRAKITVFLSTVLVVVVLVGAAMHVVEEPDSGFSSIPESMYWAIVTLTTVGYGDIAPQTVLGKVMASVIMILGYSLIIVPMGIISAELVRPSGRPVSTQACPSCSKEGHDFDAVHCKYCGVPL